MTKKPPQKLTLIKSAPKTNANASAKRNTKALRKEPVHEALLRIRKLTKEEIAVEYLPLVKIIAQKTVSRLPHNIEISDLISVGMIGLLKAWENYDPKQGFQFNTFAEHRIRGAMLDELRRQDWMPRSLRTKEKKLSKAIKKVEARTGKKATTKDIARQLGISEDDVADMQTKTNTMVKTYDDLSKLDQDHTCVILQFPSGQLSQKTPDAVTSEKSRNERMRAIVRSLPKRQADVLSLYYYEELNLREIGERLQLTESRVSQIHAEAIRSMKQEMEHEEEDFAA